MRREPARRPTPAPSTPSAYNCPIPPAATPTIAPQKQMTGMLGHPVAENPIDRMFDAVYAHHGLHWQFWKNDIANESDLALAVKALRPA